MCNKKIENKFLSTDYFFGVLNSGKTKIDEFIIYLDKIGSDKSIEVCIHPSNTIYENNKINKRSFYYNKNRSEEKKLLMSDEFKNLLKKKKINLINFSDIN